MLFSGDSSAGSQSAVAIVGVWHPGGSAMQHSMDSLKGRLGARQVSGDISKVQYRIQFLDGMASVILDLVADARDAASAIALVVDLDWPLTPTASVLRTVHRL